MERRIFVITIILFCLVVTVSGAVEVKNDYPIKPVPVSAVKLSDGFWQRRVETNRKVTIPYSLAKCEESGRIDNFAIAGGLKDGSHKGHYFNDSDVFKVVEGACYSLMDYPDAELEKYLDEIIAKIAAGQEKDGYLYTARTANPDNPPEHSGKQRWSKLRYSHELYNLGHLYEAAAAYYEATGKRNLLDVATKSADLLVRTFGADKKRDTSGHEEVEIGLVRLYRVTGKNDYLALAKFFIDERGNHHDRESYKDFRQDHKPFIQQDHAVGHAVSGAYLYGGAADVAVLTSNSDYARAVNRIWWDVVTSKLYITGVAAGRGEKFGDPYKLPNLKGYNETCAAIGLAMWNYRMFLSSGDSRYIDLVERSIYNTVLAGVSLGGEEFFYSNPLESDGKHKFNGIDVPDDELTASRWPWFLCACCPSNITRFIPQVQSYAYAVKENDIYVNLYIAGEATITTANNTIKLKVDTKYPWEGQIRITVDPQKSPANFSLKLRVPGWARNSPVPGGLYRYLSNNTKAVRFKVIGEEIEPSRDKGYAVIKRYWHKGDEVVINIPMPVRRVLCNEKIEDNRGKVALDRGPIVYCVEWPDNDGNVSDISIGDSDKFEVEYRNDMLGGVNVIKGDDLLAIPYYAWAHRGEGEMKVWLSRQTALPEKK
jgi:DUF1680 family protein